MAEVGQQTVDFSSLVGRAAEESFVSLKELVEKSKSAELSDSDKKIGILKYVVKTQQRMLRLNVLAKWCQQVPLIQYCQELGTTLSNHDTCFTQAADSMFFMHEGLQQARAPVYDVPSAIEVLLTGSYQRLPKCIEDVGLQSTLNEDQQKPALKKLDTIVRAKLLEVSIPKEITEVKVTDGTVMLRVDGEFKVLITLGYRGHLSMWRILHMELLVGEGSGPVKLEESRRHAIGDDLERRMAAAENPFSILYSILHELCVALVMDTVIRQVQALRHGRWKDAIRFELISDGSVGQGSVGTAHDVETESVGLRTPGLKLVYWLDIDKSSGSSDALACPFLKIEPGPDLQIKCLHSSFVIDHLTDKEAEFSLDQNCIDVEKLLLRAICCNRYTRLLEIYKELEKNVQICRASEDIHLEGPENATDTDPQEKDNALKDRDYEGREVLRVRAFGSSFFTLGINIRNGRFFLLAPKNIISVTALQECEEALNQGSISAADAFTNLRNKSIMHLFACIARFFGLEVFDHGFASGKVPKNISNDQSLLLMGFPDFGNSYFLLMQIDKEFKPLFKLLEVQPDTAGNSQSLGDWNNAVCVKNIDISQMKMGEDELGSSLVKYGNLLSLLANNTRTDPVLHQNTSVGHGKEGHILTSSHQSVFSSIVDEVFELEKGSSGQVPSLPFASSSASQHRYSSVNVQSTKAGTLSPKWEGGMLISRNNNIAEGSGASHNYHSSVRSQKNVKGLLQSDFASSLSMGPGRSHGGKILSASKYDQDLAMLISPHSAGINFPSVDGNQSTVAGIQAARFYSPSQPLASEADSDRLRIPRSSSWATPTLSQQPYSAAFTNLDQETTCRHGRSSRKRTVSDLFLSIPSLMQMETAEGSHKRQKTSETLSSQLSISQLSVSTELTSRREGYSYADLIAEANKGNVPSSIYVSALLHVVRHSSLCIKHALLTSQMEVLGIPFVEEVDLRSTSSSTLWFRLPFAKNDTWQHICLRLGQPGSMCWDVIINDQHFRDLWELQKGSDHTPWDSGVRVASLSDVDSHIRYDSEGVILSYQSVEADSIKNLVADIQRLSNSRTFALGMRKLLGVRADDKSEEIGVNSDGKLLVTGGKSAVEIPDKLSEQIKRSFKIEAVGLMSLWFSFGSGVMARFVVEWESGKEGCTMHVSPDQLWPHTKVGTPGFIYVLFLQMVCSE
ncbi:general transcription factor [Lithospermum erythrorhizon]|uniref:Mediator of RNA polymerase II transcription subunit 14 n=1 Tax=Lithospermum erythrorhizon TaxID=34254 RepID=A0AAV3RTJ6_LITER